MTKLTRELIEKEYARIEEKKRNLEVFEPRPIQAQYDALFQALYDVDPNINIKANSNDGEFDIRFAGDSGVYRWVYSTLREHGWEPEDRISDDTRNYFTTWYRKEGLPSLYVTFSSTVCQRVQVGTRTVEEPIYELVCE